MIVEDADEHCRQSKAAGAKVVLDIKDEDYGGRGYFCREHLWNFGTYDAWDTGKT